MVVVLLPLLLVALLWRGGARPADAKPAAARDGADPGDGPSGSGYTPGPAVWKIPPAPPAIRDPETTPGAPLSANSLVMRPAKIDKLRAWDVISDHVAQPIGPELSFTTDGLLDVRCRNNGPAHYLWDFDQGGLFHDAFGGVYAAAAPDRATCARLEAQSVQIFEKERPTVIARSLPTPGVTWAEWSHGGNDLAVYGAEGVGVWNADQAALLSACGEVVRPNPNATNIGRLAWSPDNQWLVAWNAEYPYVYRIDVATGKLTAKVSTDSPAYAVSLRPQGDLFAVYGGDGGKVGVCGFQSPHQLHTFAAADNRLFRFQAKEQKKTYDLTPKEFADKYGWTNDPEKVLKQLR